MIIDSAFDPQAALGGAVGLTVMKAIQSGVARGIFSNESGLGSAPIAAAAAQTREPVRQGLISMTGTFLDTIIVCTMTGIVLVLTGAWNNPELAGATVTNYAFAQGLGTSIGATIVTVGLLFFCIHDYFRLVLLRGTLLCLSRRYSWRKTISSSLYYVGWFRGILTLKFNMDYRRYCKWFDGFPKSYRAYWIAKSDH